MDYGRLGPSEPAGGASDIPKPPHPATSSRKRKLILLSILSFALIIASAVSATLLIGLRTRGSGGGSGPGIHAQPTQAISKTCSKTRYPTLCVNSLLDFPGALSASEQDLVHISFNMTLQHFNKALFETSGISFVQMDPLVRSAYDDCLELLDDSIDALTRSFLSVAQDGNNNNQVGSKNDVMTWLSAALTNHDTCAEGFEDVSGDVKNQVSEKLKDLAELVSNCLAIFSGSVSDDFGGVPIQNRRRLMEEISPENEDAFPRWLGRKERELLSTPNSAIRADIIVSKDGNGSYKTIAEAIKKAPENSNRRTIIYVKAGR
ncbi:Plant invertase/pectin methylesterase inhibitor superfamily isoform 1 [Tripterygium wilfordii]|uniref:pectinesterase n=3 Tax=Tripterygium wilfordii TaxID=458696 RepID=A0A7J7DAS0_TRIWF|nr:Plant invertase/pectin methylesterase inhibitor superfamily isoform 1 [Tripterygium wilfordii]